MKPVCFMVMPFRTKSVPSDWVNAPGEIDCDRLWDHAIRPALQKLGYIPVRADLDPGSVIVKDMLNRLRHAHLVLADVSLPNGNVYYEIGIRHVARKTKCVLIAAEWSKPLFDLEQIRTLRYPLADGGVPQDQAAAIRKILVKGLPPLCTAKTPYHVLVDEQVPEEFSEQADQISEFQTVLAEIRLISDDAERKKRVRKLVQSETAAALALPEIALELLYLIRDTLDWSDVCDFVKSLPEAVRRTETVQEQHFLALSEQGDVERAVAGMNQLIERFGPTPERCGILGGRYKRLYRTARDERKAGNRDQPDLDERKWLGLAIKAYEQGMMLDLNEFYCSCNLPALLRARGRKGDIERAASIDTLVIAACRRAEERGSNDRFLPDTLFGTAFRNGDVAALDDIIESVETGVRWRLGSTLSDAEDWIQQAPAKLQGELKVVLERLRTAYEQTN